VGSVRETVWVWVREAWMLPCRGPMPGGDVICGGARARLESRDSRLGAGSEPAELVLLLGSNRARAESRVLQLVAGPGRRSWTELLRSLHLDEDGLGSSSEPAAPSSQGSLQFQSSTISPKLDGATTGVV
jgi:hypothetical protein